MATAVAPPLERKSKVATADAFTVKAYTTNAKVCDNLLSNDYYTISRLGHHQRQELLNQDHTNLLISGSFTTEETSQLLWNMIPKGTR